MSSNVSQKLISQFDTPYHFRATRCCVSLLTGPIYGSTLSIPEHFLQTSFQGGYDRKHRGETLS